jgi:hypothetical protein
VNNDFQGFRSATKSFIDEYVDQGVLSAEIALLFYRAEKVSELLKALSVAIGSFDVEKLWMHVVWNVWIGVYDEDDRETVFNEYDNVFFRELLREGGVISRKKVVSKVLRTPYMTDKVASNLDSLGVIDVYKLGSGDVYYALSLRLLSEAKLRG